MGNGNNGSFCEVDLPYFISHLTICTSTKTGSFDRSIGIMDLVVVIEVHLLRCHFKVQCNFIHCTRSTSMHNAVKISSNQAGDNFDSNVFLKLFIISMYSPFSVRNTETQSLLLPQPNGKVTGLN